MTELQLSFLMDLVINYVVITGIANLAFGRGNIWVVGHGSLLACGGIYAWAAFEYSAPVGIVVAILAMLFWSMLLSLGAVSLRGDRFIVVSLASAYAAYSMSIAVFGDGVRDVPGALTYSGKLEVVLAAFCVAVILTVYLVGLSRSKLDPILMIARDEPIVLDTSGLPSKPTIFWLHLISCIPVGLIGILAVVFETGYSANLHSITYCLLLFVVVFGFGTNTVIGCVAAAFCVTTLERAIEIALASQWADPLFSEVLRYFGMSRGTETASNIAVPLTQGILAVFLIFAVRYRPEGLFGKESRWIRK